ncbi:hypothetical protein NH340_JMT07007 [Sarcoptes scabiei]|nr:hypothetical protein NH340_JMT07007 [Sarcoptes scabiei]
MDIYYFQMTSEEISKKIRDFCSELKDSSDDRKNQSDFEDDKTDSNYDEGYNGNDNSYDSGDTSSKFSSSEQFEEQSIPDTFLPFIENASIGDIITPGSFYVLNNDNQKEYELLEQSIQEFYSNNSSKKVSIHSGQYYAAKYPAKNIWARAKCLTKLNSTAIVGLFIDYGIVAEVSLDSLRSLDSQFISLPPRSFKTALSGVGHDDTIWSSAVVAHFKKLVEGITFSVINEETDSPNDRRSLLATDDLSINEEMIEFISNN